MAKKAVMYRGLMFPTIKALAEVAQVPASSLSKLLRDGLTAEEAISELKGEPIAEEPVVEQMVEEVKEEIIEETPSAPSFNNPAFFTITNPIQIIKELKESNFECINLIDFENVHYDDKLMSPYITKKNALNIFFYNACIYSNQFFKYVKNNTNINLQVLIYETGDQLVDHLITYYLGALLSSCPDKEYNILSKDSGFYPFIRSLNVENVTGVGYNYIQDKEDRYHYSLGNFILQNNILSNRHIIKYSEFEIIFKDFCRKKLTPEVINDLINTLVKLNFIEVLSKGNGDLKMYKFKLDVIKRFLNGVSK